MRTFWLFWTTLLIGGNLFVYVAVSYRQRPKVESAINFESFDNETGTGDGCYIVPNYVHFVRFNKPKLSFVEAVCILSAFKRQNPEKIFIHTNVRAVGKYWDVVMKTEGIKDVLVFKKMEIPKSIFGQALNPLWLPYHGGDVARLKILLKYGGIFLDNDSYLVRNVDKFRAFEMAIGWRPGKSLQNQVVITHKDGRFLRLWMNSYKDNYKPKKWYYNAGQFPTEILEDQPHLVHRVEQLFGGYGVVKYIYERKWPEWRNYFALHLMIRHQRLLKNINENATFPVVFNEVNIHKYPNAFRDMVYDVYPFEKKNST